jgi:hypothetical protein
LPPVFFDPPGSCTVPASVSLSVPGYPDALIYYTLDCSTPTPSSLPYSGAIYLQTPTVVRAFARDLCYHASPAASAVFGNCSTLTVANPTPITIPDGRYNDPAKAVPYPSTINVSGLPAVWRLTVTINGMTHGWPDDIDMLLVSPEGQKVMLMSDAGNGYPVTNVTIAFADDAATPIPDQPTAPIIHSVISNCACCATVLHWLA